MSRKSGCDRILLATLTGAAVIAVFSVFSPENRVATAQDVPSKSLDDPAPVPPKLRSDSGRSVRGPARQVAKTPVLDLEDAITRADLILAVRLVDMTEAKIVHGGKTEVVTQQFRFEPVRTIKGIFARDALLLTGQDLGIYQFGDAADRLERGQLLLLLLGRQGPGLFNCNTSGTLEQSIPRLKDQNDPLLTSVESLIRVTQQRDRAKKVATLISALKKAKDRDAAPLLISLGRRPLIAARTEDAGVVVASFLKNPRAEIRETAAKTLGSLLMADAPHQGELQNLAVKSLVETLEASESDFSVRIAAFEALGVAGEAARKSEGAKKWLRADRPATTFAEDAARLAAIGGSGWADQRDAVATYLDRLPLDAPLGVQIAAARALVKLDGAEAARKLGKRVASKSEAGISIATEIPLLGDLPRELAVPALLDVSSRMVTNEEQMVYAIACGRVADPRLVPSLAELLDPRFPNVRWQASEALRRIDTDEAASVVWPQLAGESNLTRKLELSEFLGRHGYKGGYPYAIEHMSAPMLRDAAVNALAAIQEPKAVAELRKIWASSNDLAWNSAAIRALGRLGQADIAPRLLEIARDRRNPLAASALIALGDLGQKDAIPIALEGLGSRSDDMVISSIRAARRLLTIPDVKGDAIRDRLAAIVTDGDTGDNVRTEALEALVALDDPRLDAALAVADRDGGIENTALVARVEELIRTRKSAPARS